MEQEPLGVVAHAHHSVRYCALPVSGSRMTVSGGDLLKRSSDLRATFITWFRLRTKQIEFVGTAMRTNQVLKLLLLARPMDTTAHWRDALKQLETHGDQQNQQQQETQRTASPEAAAPAHFHSFFLDAVDAVVPHLPEYSALALQLEALLEFCRVTYPLKTDQMICIWLQRGATTSTAFRTWLLEWITTKKPFEQKDSDENEDNKQQWQHALFAAAVVEEHVELKRVLIQLLHHVGPMKPADEELNLLPQNPQQQASISVEELLDFFWDHAEELMPFTLLCAVKLHALASNSDGSSRGFVQLTDGVLVRLRWSKLLKSIFFEALLSQCLVLKVFQSNIAAETFEAHRFLQLQVTEVSWTKRNLLLERLHVVKERLEDAYKANAAHFSMKKATSKNFWTESAAEVSGHAFLTLAEDQQRFVLLDLEQGLEDAPPRIFPHIMVSFGAIIGAALSLDVQASDKVFHAALKTLFALCDLRRDCESYFLAAGLVVELRLVHHPVWAQAPGLFAEIVESLNEAFTMETAVEKRWVLQMLLQQLLFECDAGVLLQSLPTLASFLPTRLLRLATVRLS